MSGKYRGPSPSIGVAYIGPDRSWQATAYRLGRILHDLKEMAPKALEVRGNVAKRHGEKWAGRGK